MPTGGDWRFLVDECMEPAIARDLRSAGIQADHVQEVAELGKGADDTSDILPYLNRTDAIFVTNNFRDFGAIPFEDHHGILIDYDGRRSSQEIVAIILRIIRAYPSRDELRHKEPMDDWA